MYDNTNNEPWWHIHFMQGKVLDIKNNIIFNVKNTKWAKLEHILKWDFLPNSTRIPLANDKALKLLEEGAPGQFQAIPTELRMPDGSVIKDYKLINVLNKFDSLIHEKCVLKPERFRTDWDKYEVFYHKSNCLAERNLNIAIDDSLVFIGSNKLRKAVKEHKLTGMIFKDTYAGCHKFLEE
ncbi:hypothetical protein I862_07515 [endosymbiont of Acanthamoeba sp. UWC8]|uniref:hypothetical protein n=1 Tax=endosymbiont of Acanthamoeba sp. UWC8 TaxID=86106 RepID=UPI0004D0D4B8|nr:hypothetical protein [endosymbiont of Acanthamoeba sp. UWC8]AIF82057.1 hypothetical protein I862_07515 [endosymbiont of Acanthamoeba sp. UWC8]